MKKRILKGIQLFIDYYEKNGAVISRKDFMDYGFCMSHYYKTKKEFEEYLEELKNEGDEECAG